MKTIESLAAEKYHNQKNLPAHKQIPAVNFIDWANFGAKEAQRWISVNDELPEEEEFLCSSTVLLQIEVYNQKEGGSYLCHIDAYFSYATNEWKYMVPINDENLKLTPMAWRPVERS